MPKILAKRPSVFCEKLAELRKSRQLTQEEFAERIGLSLSTVAYYESAAKNPKLETIYRIAEFFNVSPAELVVDDDDSPTMKPGPESRLELQVKRIRRLSPAKQRMILGIIDAALNAD